MPLSNLGAGKRIFGNVTVFQLPLNSIHLKYLPPPNTHTHTHPHTHRNIHTHIWMGQCTLIRDGMSLDAAIRVLPQHLGTHTVQKPLLTLGSGVASLPSHQAASMPWGWGDPANISSSSAPDPLGTKTAQGPVHTWTPLQDQNR